MKKFLEYLPIPICGVMLGIASLGNVLKMVCENMLGLPGLGYIIHVTFGFITAILLLLVLLKIIFCFRMVVVLLDNPEMGGIFFTYPMTLMIFASYLPDFVGQSAAEIFWWVGVLVHYTCMVIFTYKYVIRDFKLPELLPPWYIVYTGFALSGFDSTNYAPGWFGAASFWIGFICFWIIFFMLIKRYREYPIRRMDEPTLCINAAVGICLTSYVRNFAHPNVIMIFFLYFASLFIWIWIMFKLPKFLKLPFYPTDSAMSFPFVVSAIASMEGMRGLMEQGIMIRAWNYPIMLVQSIVALIMVFLIGYRFVKHMIISMREGKPTSRMMKMNMADKARDMQMHEGLSPENKKELGKAVHMQMG